MRLSLIIPCYNEEGNVEKFFSEVKRVFDGKVEDCEFVFVNDGSKDKTYQRLKKLYNDEKDNSNIQVISFSRNFGKEAAIYAGLTKSTGDLVCLIDADLQQRPEVVLEMLDVMNSDADIDCVTAYQDKRKESAAISFLKSSFYKLINKISDVEFVNGASDFRLMKRTMVDAVLQMTEFHRFSKGIFSYVGFNTKYIPYTVAERESGESKWSVKKLTKYAFEGIFAFSTTPLKISAFVGLLSALGSLVYLIVILVMKYGSNAAIPSYSAVIVLLLLVGGLILFCLGIVGEYLSKMYVQVKNRPVYIVKEHLNSSKK